MRRVYIPDSDNDVLAWLNNLVTILSATPVAYGLVAADLTAITAAVTAYEAALTAHRLAQTPPDLPQSRKTPLGKPPSPWPEPW